MFGNETVVCSYIVPALCEHISVFQLAENVPVNEGGDAVLYCNFGEQSDHDNMIGSHLHTSPTIYPRCAGVAVSVAQKWSHCQPLLGEVRAHRTQGRWRLLSQVEATLCASMSL